MTAPGKTVDLKKMLAIGKAYGKPTSQKLKWKIKGVEFFNWETYSNQDITEETTKGKTKLISLSSKGVLKSSAKLKKKLDKNDRIYVEIEVTDEGGTSYGTSFSVVIWNGVSKISFEKAAYTETLPDILGEADNPYYLISDYFVYSDKETFFSVTSSNPDIAGVCQISDWGEDEETGMYKYEVQIINNKGLKGTVTLNLKALDGSGKTAKTKITYK